MNEMSKRPSTAEMIWELATRLTALTSAAIGLFTDNGEKFLLFAIFLWMMQNTIDRLNEREGKSWRVL